MTADPSERLQRVLAVDDSPQNLLLVEANLVNAGYAVSLAESGERAVAAFEEQAPDLVLLDIMMPDMDGFETLRRLRRLPGGLETPILFLTAQGDLGTHREALESGADDFLTKPLNRTELLLRVRSLVRLKRIHSELLRGQALIASQRDALIEAQKQKEELTGFIVHDMKNPLMGIMANAQLMARDGTLAERTRRSLDDVQTAAESLHRMVMNLADVSRSEDGALVPVPVDFDVPALIEEVCRPIRRRAEARDQKLRVEIALPRCEVRADRDLVRRLLENLLDNALRYTPSRGTIRLEARSSERGPIEIRVRDEGRGVPPAYRSRIFEKDVQLDSDPQARGRAGRGLGLVFCRLAVEAHGGRIWIEDNEPAGAVFCVSLPAR